MFKYGFDLQWSKEDEGFIATCPDFPGLSAFGETPGRALAEAQIALGLFIESLQASGDRLPEASEVIEYSGQIRLRIPKSLHASLAQNAAKEEVSLNTWMVTLLAERNSASSLTDKICSRIEAMDETIKAHRAETKELTEWAKVANSTYTTIASSITGVPLQPPVREAPSMPTAILGPYSTGTVIADYPIRASSEIYTSKATSH